MNEQTVIKTLAIFEPEFFCVPEKSFKDTNTARRIGKRIPISASIPSNPVEYLSFQCISDPYQIVIVLSGNT